MEKVKFDKLPKWAQTTIDLLHRRIEHLSELLKKVGGAAADSKVCARLDSEVATALPEDVEIRFTLGDRWDDFITVTLNRRGGITIRGGRGLQIAPIVTNVIEVNVEGWK